MAWEKVKLGDIAESVQTGPFGSQLHQSDYSEFGTPVVMPKDMIGGKILEDTIARVEEQHVNRLSRHKVNVGDILYARRGDVGKCALVTENEKGWLCGTGCLKVSIDFSKANPKFVFYQLQKLETVGWVEKHAVGATMLNLNTGILESIPIELPKLSEQNKIVDILSAYDNLIENNQKQIKLLEEAAQRLYKQWFIDLRFPGHETTPIVDGLPEGWRKGCLADIVRDVGINEKKENRTNYSYYLPIDCLPKKSLTYTDFNNIELAESSLVAFSENDIVFGAMRPYFHKVVVARDPGLTRSTCFVINTLKQSMWSYAVMLLFDAETIKYATKISVGTTMPYVRWKDFISMPILIPHENVTKDFNRIICPIIDRLKKISKQNIYLKQARDHLLPKLMNGEKI